MKLELLTLNDELYAYPAPEAYHIQEFAILIRRDRGSSGDSQGRKKLRASKELAYIYNMVNYKSPYVQHFPDEKLRQIKVKLAIFGEEDWESDEVVEAALLKYSELVETPLIKMIKAALNSVYQMEQYFKEVDWEDRDHKGAMIYKPADVFQAIKNIPHAVEGLTKLQEQIEQEESASNKTRGNVQLNRYSRGRSIA